MYVVAVSDFLQIREIGNHRGFLTAERQVDETLDIA
jgi:hypothetical protein